MKDVCLELKLCAKQQAAGCSLNADRNHIISMNLGLLALFSKNMLSSSSAKDVENIEKALIACSINKVIKNSKLSDVLSISCDRYFYFREQRLTINENNQWISQIRVTLTDIFGFAEQSQKTIYGLA